jgi:hypothetical protein
LGGFLNSNAKRKAIMRRRDLLWRRQYRKYICCYLSERKKHTNPYTALP